MCNIRFCRWARVQIVPRRGRVHLPDHCEPRPYTLLIGCPRRVQTRGAWAPARMAMKASQIGCPVARKTLARITAPKNTEFDELRRG
jgi:hypothetical protein